MSAGGEYAPVHGSFWSNPEIRRKLDPHEKLLLLYWFTSPHGNLSGVYFCPFTYAAAETGLPIEDVRNWTIGALSRWVTYDTETEEVFVHGAAERRIGADPKPTDYRLKGVLRILEGVHSRKLVEAFLDRYAHWPLADVENSPSDPPGKGASKGLQRGSEAPHREVNKTRQDRSKQQSRARTRKAPNVENSSPADDSDQQRTACVEFVERHGYGATERLIAEGEDIQAWRTPSGSLAPWPDRLRLLKLAHARVADGKSDTLRAGLRYVIPQTYDPFPSPQSTAPKPGTEAAAVRSEMPQERRSKPSTNGLERVAQEPEQPPPIDLQAEIVERWERENPELAERIRTSIARRIDRGEGPKALRAQRAWADAEYRSRVLEIVNGKPTDERRRPQRGTGADPPAGTAAGG